MKNAFILCAGITLVLLGYGTYQGLVVAPREETMGAAQRIFYYHVPAAWALAAAEVGLVFATVTLAFGMIWARYAWGHWWAWDLRLTTFLILWLLYISYRMLRGSTEAGSTSVLAAALAVMVFIDVPINYMANRWFRTNHPQPVTLDDPRMKFALMTTHDCLPGICRFDCLVSLLRGAHRAEDRRHARSENGSAFFCRAAGSAFSPAAVGNRPASSACLYVQWLHCCLGDLHRISAPFVR